MKSILGILLFIFLAFQTGWGQGLVFCLDHTKDGRPLAPDSIFELDQFGQEIDFLYQGGGDAIADKLYFFIDKEVEGGGYLEYDTKTMEADSGQSWAALSYRFERSGRYRVMLLDGEKQELCRGALKVNVLRDVGGPSYYRDAVLAFCNRVKDGEADTELDRVSLGSGKRRDLRVLVRHYRPLRCERLVVDVWMLGPDGVEMRYVETMDFQIEPHWMFTQFEYAFREPGRYSFRVYSEDEVWIASREIMVVR